MLAGPDAADDGRPEHGEGERPNATKTEDDDGQRSCHRAPGEKTPSVGRENRQPGCFYLVVVETGSNVLVYVFQLVHGTRVPLLQRDDGNGFQLVHDVYGEGADDNVGASWFKLAVQFSPAGRRQIILVRDTTRADGVYHTIRGGRRREIGPHEITGLLRR